MLRFAQHDNTVPNAMIAVSHDACSMNARAHTVILSPLVILSVAKDLVLMGGDASLRSA